MKTEKNQDWNPKSVMAEPSEEQHLEENHLKPEKTKEVEVDVEEEEDEEMEESDDDEDVKNQVENQKPEFNTNMEQNRSEVDGVKDIEGVEGNKITNRENEIVNKEGQ